MYNLLYKYIGKKHTLYWLVVWNIFFHILGIMIPIDELHHFSEGLVNHQPVYIIIVTKHALHFVRWVFRVPGSDVSLGQLLLHDASSGWTGRGRCRGKGWNIYGDLFGEFWWELVGNSTSLNRGYPCPVFTIVRKPFKAEAENWIAPRLIEGM